MASSASEVCWELHTVLLGKQLEARAAPSLAQPRPEVGCRAQDPHSLGMLDGSVQGAEKCAALLHHAVEVGLVEEVTLGVTEVLGAKPGRGTVVRGDPGAPATTTLPAPLLCQEAPHLRRYTFQGSDSFS